MLTQHHLGDVTLLRLRAEQPAGTTLQLMLTGLPHTQLPAVGDAVALRLDLSLVHIMPSRTVQP